MGRHGCGDVAGAVSGWPRRRRVDRKRIGDARHPLRLACQQEAAEHGDHQQADHGAHQPSVHWSNIPRLLDGAPTKPYRCAAFHSSREAAMGKINVGRVVLGGLLAGLVFNVFEGLVTPLLLGDLMTQSLAALGKSMPESAAMMAYYVGLGFLWGIFGVWIYAAIRPRFGPGPKTALIAAMVL